MLEETLFTFLLQQAPVNLRQKILAQVDMCLLEEKREKRLFKHTCPDFLPAIYGAGAWLALWQLATSLNDTSKHSSSGDLYDGMGT